MIKASEGSDPYRTAARGIWNSGENPVIYGELIPPDVIAALINIDTRDQDSGTGFFGYGTKNYQNWIKMKHEEAE